MNYYQLISGIGLFCGSFSVLFAESRSESQADFSQIEEEMLLNPPGAGSTSDKVIIYSRVRNRTIEQAMDTQFHRIGNMMFVNTIIQKESGELTHATDEECD